MGIISLRPTWLQVALVTASVGLARRRASATTWPTSAPVPTMSPTRSPRAQGAATSWWCAQTSSAPRSTRALEQDDATLDVVRYPDLGDARFVDWRDYEERNEAASPARVARRLVARADGAHVWVVWNGSYRTFDGQCEALIGNLSVLIGVATPDQEYEGAFETSHLVRFG